MAKTTTQQQSALAPALCAVMLLLGCCGCVSAYAPSPKAAPNPLCQKAIYATQLTDKIIFQGEFLPGTQFWFKDPLVDQYNNKIGFLVGACTVSDVIDTSFCNIDAKFIDPLTYKALGTISVQGEFFTKPGTVFQKSIIGGTGAYLGAGGFVQAVTSSVAGAVPGPWKLTFNLQAKPSCY